MTTPAKVLFLTADLGGNVPPTLAVAEELARRGAVVEIAGLQTVRPPLVHVPFPPATQTSDKGLRRGGALFSLMAGRRAAEEVGRLVGARHPDVPVVDCLLPAPLRGALDTGAPVVVLFPTFGGFWIHDFDTGVAGRIFGLLGLRPSTLWNRATARLLLTDAELDPGRDDPALVGYDWTGTTEQCPAAVGGQGRPRVLVALSNTD